MNRQFNGERLKKARIYRGLTVTDLAERVGCQRQTLSMYEISKSQPTDNTIISNIARELEFPINFFYEESSQNISQTVYFRSLLTTNKKYRNEQCIKMEFLSQVYKLLQDYIDFPTFTPIDFCQDLSIEDAALKLREEWGLGLGPIDNLVAVVEQHGILVTTFNTRTDDVDAFSQLVETDTYDTFLLHILAIKLQRLASILTLHTSLVIFVCTNGVKTLRIFPKRNFAPKSKRLMNLHLRFYYQQRLSKEMLKQDLKQ